MCSGPKGAHGSPHTPDFLLALCAPSAQPWLFAQPLPCLSLSLLQESSHSGVYAGEEKKGGKGRGGEARRRKRKKKKEGGLERRCILFVFLIGTV